MEYYSISRDINNHFKRLPKYITPRGVIFYNVIDYDNYMKEYIECQKKYKNLDLDNSIHSKK